ncbi:MAG: hypothetical protein ISN28_01570 [Ectothiorhodospiraceae bacterium AqS1]|nr:hypothetical protein [Ectothiorhodospiraceae bacterium AqS1]
MPQSISPIDLLAKNEDSNRPERRSSDSRLLSSEYLLPFHPLDGGCRRSLREG